MASFEALYGKSYRSPVFWNEVGQWRLLGLELVQTTNEAIQKIRARMLTAQRVLRFGRKGKLSPRFIEPFEILEWIGLVAYQLALPPSLSAVHNLFHVSMLRMSIADSSHIVDYKPLNLNENLSCEEKPIQILAKKVKVLRKR
ncbi:uncharacterized protein LOC120080176 [Benincasa hispida]|uniref:uncharacterized protein LOC120080176 n=1 Tax=Benincasa hispida TaxID=102211 RepID=UPI001901B001|nr:uncharacterized protein LOC120080176 [Benincasa hispida]